MITRPILLVEDEPTNVFFFQHAATKVGITNVVQVARDGREALDYLGGHGGFEDRTKFPLPGIVILDLKLPHATGFEVLQYMRADPWLRSLIVVILSSSASDDDINRAYALGANAYLVKPFNLGELISVVQSVKDFWLTPISRPGSERADAPASSSKCSRRRGTWLRLA